MTPESSVRPIPKNPNLEFDRKQAKALLEAVRAGDAVALSRFEAHHPRYVHAADPAALAGEAALHEAQLVIAREYGFASWPRWKQFVQTRRLDRAQRAAALLAAACSNDVRKARMLLEIEPELAAFDVYAACACGDAAAVERMLARDADLARRAGGPWSAEPIIYACFSRFLRADSDRAAGIVQIAKLLLERGADPNAHYWMDSGGERWYQSALYGAAGIANNVALTRALLDSGARVQPEDKESLYHAAEFPDPECLRLLLERGQALAEQVSYCLARATDFDYPEHVRLFVAAGADPNFRINWAGLRTQLHKAVYISRSVEIVRMLIDAGGDVNATDGHGFSVLGSAIRNGDEPLVDLLRSRGAMESGAMRDVSKGAPITLCIAAGRNDVAKIDRLLDGGADVDSAGGPDRTTPLHWAAWRGRFEAVRRLVERGADIHRINTYGGDALATAIHGSSNCFDPDGGPGMRLPEEAFAGDYPQIVEYLIARGAHLPKRIMEGSEAVREVLRRRGVPDGE